MRTLVTGGNGFVGRYLCAELRERGHDVIVAARTADGAVPGIDPVVDLDLADAAGVARVVADARAHVVFHLAAQAFVPRSIERPVETYATNVVGTAHLIDAIRALPHAERPRLLFVSSGEVYGPTADSAFPLRETVPATPANPYAASKAAGEAIVLASARTYGISALVTRGFNHIGPGQNELFAVPAFAARLARIAAGGDPLFPVGNLSARRDFLDVRDVVRAYADLAERGADGEIYNVCSGVPVAMVDIVRRLVTIAHVGVEIREDPALMRPVDVPVIYGDATKLRAATGWEPAIPLARSLREIYERAVAETGRPA